MNPLNIFTAIVSKLSGSSLAGDIGDRFYADIAPEGVEFPYCVFSLVTGSPEYTFTENFETLSMQFSLYSISDGLTEITSMYEHLTALFDDCTLSISGQTFIWMQRENENTMYDDITTVNGTVGLRHWAISYSLMVQV
jgi:hypothetical protein